MNTVVPALLLLLGLALAWSAASGGVAPVVAEVVGVVVLVAAWHLVRSGVAVLGADQLRLRGALRTRRLPRDEVERLEVDGLGRDAALSAADHLVVLMRDGTRRDLADFAQSSYARGRRHSLDWLVGRINAGLTR